MESVYDELAQLQGKRAPQRGATLDDGDDPNEIATRIVLLGAALTEFFAVARTMILLGGFHEAVANESRMHRRAQRTESNLARSRRETDGQRKRAEWWREEAKRLGWGTQLESIVPQLRDQLLARVSSVDATIDIGITAEAWVVKPIEEAKITVTMVGDPECTGSNEPGQKGSAYP